MKFGLRETDIQKINMILSKYSKIDKTIIYGSRAKGNYSDSSDIDLTLVGENLNFSTQCQIEDELDDILLPYKIDLSIFHQISNSNLIAHINRIGKIFYQNNLSKT